MGSNSHKFACISMATVHLDEFCTYTIMGYWQISLVRAVSVQVMFLWKL